MSSDEKKKINGIMVIEVLGRPPEYLTETLNNLIKTMSEEKGVSVKERKVMEPVTTKENPDFYASFAEIEVETEDVLGFVLLMFKYMPAHVEILSPQILNLSHSGFNDILNELTRRLHGYEEVTRILSTEKMILENQLKTILGEQREKEEEIKNEEEDKQEVKESKKETKIKKQRKPRTKKAKEEKIEEKIVEDIEEGGVPEKAAKREEKIAEEIEKESEEEE